MGEVVPSEPNHRMSDYLNKTPRALEHERAACAAAIPHHDSKAMIAWRRNDRIITQFLQTHSRILEARRSVRRFVLLA
jgi:hypothetical protein